MVSIDLSLAKLFKRRTILFMNASHSPSARVEILELRIAPAALVVLNVADSGAGSFRQALLDAEANGTSEPDIITFAIPSGPYTISPLTPFPVVSQGVTIDGTSQPGYSGSPVVQLDGAAIVASASGLQLSADTVVKGLSITRFTAHGIDMTSASRVSVLGNWVGVDSLGNPAGNGGSGVYSGGVPSLAVVAIGGPGTNEGNLLSGNARYGIETYSDYSGQKVLSNLIGTSPIGTSSMGNTLGGVYILGGAEIQDNVVAGNSGPGIYVNARYGDLTVSGNRVGLNATGGAIPNLGNGMTLEIGAFEERQAYSSPRSVVENNTVSGNTGIGISLSAKHTTVSSNTIGLSVLKNAPVPNGGDGIRVVSGDAIQILSNTISANGGNGIDIGVATDVRVSTNFIGTNDAGLVVGNGGHGIKSAADTRYRETFVRPYTRIPSHSSFDGNVIQNNGGDGIAIVGGHAVLSANLLRNNAGLGIDLADNGSSANDANDSDTGPNDLLNTPTLSLGAQLPDGLRVDGTYHGLPATQFEIQVFSVQSVADEAGAYIGAFSITTDASGNASFSNVIPGVTVTGTNIVATASSGQNKTSEISLPASGILSGVSIADTQVWEKSSGQTFATVQVVRTNGFGAAIVNYTTASGTALAGSDFVAQSGTITFSDGETAKTIQISVTGDSTPELDESFSVILSNPVSAAIADGSGLVTIKNDDLAGVFSVQGGSVIEGDSNIDYADYGQLPFTVTLAQPLGQPTTVNYSVGPQSGQITFAPGETSKTVWYGFFGDNDPEHDEVIYLNILNPFTGDQVTRGSGTIVNNDTYVYISGSSIVEGGVATVTFTLAPPIPFQKSINYNTTSNTATTGVDFQPASGTLMFAAGETTTTISIQTNSDRATEGDETFFLDFSNNPRRATITLIDDLTGPTIDVSGGTVVEGDSGVANVLFTVTKSRESTHFVSVNYATLAGTAASGFDFDALSGVLVFAPGENSKTLLVRVFGDAVIEGDETFTLELSSPVDGIIGVGSATATISNDDVPPPLLSIADVSADEGNGQTLITFTATLSAASLSTVTVDFAALGGTATSGVDFGIAGGTVTFAPGQTSRPVVVTVLGDSRWERDEEFSVQLSNPVNAVLSDGSATGVIRNDDLPVFNISASPSGVSEGELLEFLVSLDVAVDFEVAVGYSTIAGTALPEADFQHVEGTLVFAPGETSKLVVVTTHGDSGWERDEGFSLQLSNPVSAVFGGNSATGVIRNDDLPVLNIATGPSVSREGEDLQFVVSLDVAVDFQVAITFSTIADTALPGLDFEHVQGTLRFAPGETSKLVVVSTYGDLRWEHDEEFSVQLSNPVNAILSAGSANGVVQNDDLPVFNIATNSSVVREGEPLEFLVSLDVAVDFEVAVGYSTIAGTALPGADFQHVEGTLVFAPGETSKSVPVTTFGDRVLERRETLSMSLTAPQNGALGEHNATASIVDPVVKNPRMARWMDVDGDVVTLKSSKRVLDESLFAFDEDGRLLELRLEGNVAAGTNLMFTVDRGDSGDGLVSVGSIAADGVRLGDISVKGNLDQIIAGDRREGSLAVRSLNVKTFGASIADGFPAGSTLYGSLGRFIVKGDFTGANIHAVGSKAGFHSILVHGSMNAAGNDDSGIFADGSVRSMSVRGNVIGNDSESPFRISAGGQGGTGLAIGSIKIDSLLRFAHVSAGIGSNGEGMRGSAGIGTVSANEIVASSISAGVTAGEDGYFGTADDLRIDATSAASRIASVIAAARVEGTEGSVNDTDQFAIIAGTISKTKIARQNLTLLKGARDSVILGSSSDFSLTEFT